MVLRRFLNRKEDLARADAFLTDAVAGPRVLCLTGSEGCGKSELVRHAFSLKRDWPLVSVDAAALSDGSPRPPVWSGLAEATERQEAADGFPPRRGSLAEARRLITAGAEASFAVAARVFRPVAAVRELRDRLPDAFEAFRKPDPDKVYVRRAFEQTRCAVHVDHADQCVAEDWMFLSSLLELTRCVLLLEGPRGFEPPLARARVDYLAVAALDAHHASVLFGSLPTGLGETMENAFRVSGSLKAYGEFASRLQERHSRAGPSHGFGDGLLAYARRSFDGLLDGDRRALVALSAHAGAGVSLGTFRRYLASVNAGPAFTTDVTAVLRRLEDAVLLVRAEEGFRPPSVVMDLIERAATQRTAQLVYRQQWRDFYIDPARCGLAVTDRDRCLQAMRQCVLLQDGVGVAATLEAVGKARTDADSRSDLIGFTRWLASKFDLRAEPMVAAACARYLYSAGWFEEARDVLLAGGEPASRRTRYFLAELYCTAGPQERGIRLVEHEARQSGDRIDADSELCLKLIRLHGLRNSDRFRDARREFKQAREVQRFKTRPAYPVLLRLADSCLMADGDLDECIRLLQQSAALSMENGQFAEAASAYVALCQQYGYHDLDASEFYLAKAASLADEGWVEMPAILANKAVIALYRREVTEAGLQLLEDALILSTDLLDEILVRIDILVHRLMAGDASGSGIAELDRCLRCGQVDTEIAKAGFYNLEQACLTVGDEVSAGGYRAAWRALDSGIDAAYWRSRTHDVRPAEVPDWRLDLPYYPVLLSHWKLGTVPFDAVADDV